MKDTFKGIHSKYTSEYQIYRIYNPDINVIIAHKYVCRTDSLSQKILKSSVGIINSYIQIECSSIGKRTSHRYVGVVQY